MWRSKAIILFWLPLLSSITCNTSCHLPGSQRQTASAWKALAGWKRSPERASAPCRSTGQCGHRQVASPLSPLVALSPGHRSAHSLFPPAVPAPCSSWGSHPHHSYSCTGSNSDLSHTSTRQVHHQSTHIFRPDYLQSEQSSPALPKERLSPQHQAFFPHWNYTSTWLLNFTTVARGRIYHQIMLTILFTNPHWGQIPGKVTQLSPCAVCSLSKSGWITMCWRNVSALPVFVAEETWGDCFCFAK